jgi:ankyrin repeat protein
VIVETNYKLGQSDGIPKELRAGDYVAYQVRLQGADTIVFPSQLVHMTENDVWDNYILPLTAENVVGADVDSKLLDAFFQSQNALTAESGNRLLRHAITNRRACVAHWLSERTRVPLRMIGDDLRGLALQGLKDENNYKSCDDVQEMTDWLKEDCGVHIWAYRDKNGRNAEHLAAFRGDSKLLTWLLANCLFELRDGVAMQLDDQGRSPLHYAVKCKKIEIIECYRAGSLQNQKNHHANGPKYHIPTKEDFEKKDNKGFSPLDLAEGNVLNALNAVRKDAAENAARNATDFFGGSENWSSFQHQIESQGLDLKSVLKDKKAEVDAVFNFATKGKLEDFKWLVKELPGIHFDMQPSSIWCSVHSRPGLNLVQVVAAVDGGKLGIKDTDAERDKVTEEMSTAIEDDCNPSTIMGVLENYCAQSSGTIHLRSHIEPFKKMITGSKSAGLVGVLRWMISKGGGIPSAKFIIQDCDLPMAKLLLEYKFAQQEAIGTVCSLMGADVPAVEELVRDFALSEAEADETIVEIVKLVIAPAPRLNDVPRLLLLEWLQISRRVDLALFVVPHTGETALHLAVNQDEHVIAQWLARQFPSLRHVRDTSGQLPIHVALKNSSETMCFFMMGCSGELLPRWWSSRVFYHRVWCLEDGKGRTVESLASESNRLLAMRSDAREPLNHEALAHSREMLENNVGLEEWTTFFWNESNQLDSFLASPGILEGLNYARLLHCAVSKGRLDVLQQLSQFDAGLVHRFAEFRKNESAFSQRDIPWYPKINVQGSFRVGEKIEVLSTFRDGGWRDDQKPGFNGLKICDFNGCYQIFVDGKLSSHLVTIDHLLVSTDEPGLASRSAANPCPQNSQIFIEAASGHLLLDTLGWGQFGARAEDVAFNGQHVRRIDFHRTACTKLSFVRGGDVQAADVLAWRVCSVTKVTETDVQVCHYDTTRWEKLPKCVESIHRHSFKLNSSGMRRTCIENIDESRHAMKTYDTHMARLWTWQHKSSMNYEDNMASSEWAFCDWETLREVALRYGHLDSGVTTPSLHLPRWP